MGFKSDIEIAQECEMLPITQIAEKAGKCAIITLSYDIVRQYRDENIIAR